MRNDKEKIITAINKYSRTWGIFVTGFCFVGILFDINPIVIIFLVALISGGVVAKIIDLFKLGFSIEETDDGEGCAESDAAIQNNITLDNCEEPAENVDTPHV